MQAPSIQKDFPSSKEQSFADILNQAGFSERPIWYAGTPADGRDISPAKLETLYDLIHKAYGDKAAYAYVCTVATIPYLAPTDFIQAMWDLHNNNWEYRGSAGMNGLSIETEDAAFISYIRLSSGAFANKTEEIRAPFVGRHLNVVRDAAQKGDASCAAALDTWQNNLERSHLGFFSPLVQGYRR